MLCEAVRAGMPLFVGPEEPVDRRLARHVDSCLRCQAELAQYRRLRRGLGDLRARTPEAPDDLVADVMAHVEAGARRAAVRSARRRVAYAAAAGAAAAASVATAGALARGRRPARRA